MYGLIYIYMSDQNVSCQNTHVNQVFNTVVYGTVLNNIARRRIN